MAYETKFLYILCLLFSSIVRNVYSNVLCEMGFCEEFVSETPCPTTAHHCSINNETHHGLSMLSPTMCNCCDYCLPLFLEGDPCSSFNVGTGLTVGRCGAGLYCMVESDGNHCRRMTKEHSDCHGDQDKYDEEYNEGSVGALVHRPLCDDKGRYAPVACVPTQTCFCQDENGQRIFGEVLHRGISTIQNMQCRCSRLIEKIKDVISPGLIEPAIGPRCTSDGNFNPVQCIGRKCHCVDKINGIRTLASPIIDLDNKPITELPCYDPALDLFAHLTPPGSVAPFNFTSPCYEDMKERVDLIYQSKEDGYIVDYFTSVRECLPDGTYGRIAITRNFSKICVDERGDQIEDYEAKPNTSEYDEMNCKCAVTSQLMGSSSEKPVCCKNGNFRPIQCRRGTCRCVDSDGRQVGQESTVVEQLNHCYKEGQDWRVCYEDS